MKNKIKIVSAIVPTVVKGFQGTMSNGVSSNDKITESLVVYKSQEDLLNHLETYLMNYIPEGWKDVKITLKEDDLSKVTKTHDVVVATENTNSERYHKLMAYIGRSSATLIVPIVSDTYRSGHFEVYPANLLLVRDLISVK